MNTHTLFISIIIIQIVIIAIMAYYLSIIAKRNNKKITDLEWYKNLQEEIDSLSNKNKIYREYISLFKTYCNEDWSRETPFLTEIGVLSNTYFSLGDRSTEIVPLRTLIKDIPKEEKVLNALKNVLKENFESIQNICLGELLMFIADLKSYDGISHPEEYSSPEKYFKWRIEENKINNENE